eukprot:gnl/Spiro4/943_TR494_c0_g1_i1.p1 gnl/Spiro4/943_TR494_c0_g1~~gnl/Spiro4/943_TR494_c0_g1_i1.p1  ORF type:complete len:527 (-),score=170.15 gnl/Spiro4/943_TR494_c0_g1_i1:65-1645(-)
MATLPTTTQPDATTTVTTASAATPPTPAKPKFRAYGSIENAKNIKGKLKGVLSHEFVVTEKVHGTNSGFYVSPDDSLRVARRSGFADDPSTHYRADMILARHGAQFRAAAREIRASLPGATDVIFYGEIYGGGYPNMERLLNVPAVQHGIYYTPEIHFCCFDIVVALPTAQLLPADRAGNQAQNLWGSARKHMFLVRALQDKPDKSALVDSALDELRLLLPQLQALRTTFESLQVPGLESIDALMRLVERTLARDTTVDFAADLPCVPANHAGPAHERILTQDDRVRLCAAHGIPASQILMRGTFDECYAWSKERRALPSLVPQMHGMPLPHSPREGHVIRTNVPYYVAGTTLAILKDKNPSFSEVAHSGVSKDVGATRTSFDVLRQEARRYIVGPRVDSVRSKLPPDQPAAVLVQPLAEDVLVDMRKETDLHEHFSVVAAKGKTDAFESVVADLCARFLGVTIDRPPSTRANTGATRAKAKASNSKTRASATTTATTTTTTTTTPHVCATGAAPFSPADGRAAEY